jgi:hypothetical protein
MFIKAYEKLTDDSDSEPSAAEIYKEILQSKRNGWTIDEKDIAHSPIRVKMMVNGVPKLME